MHAEGLDDRVFCLCCEESVVFGHVTLGHFIKYSSDVRSLSLMTPLGNAHRPICNRKSGREDVHARQPENVGYYFKVLCEGIRG